MAEETTIPYPQKVDASGQDAFQLAEQTGDVTQQQVLEEQTAYPNLNPDAVVGNILMKDAATQPPPTIVTSDAAEKEDSENLAELEGLGTEEGDIVEPEVDTAVKTQAEIDQEFLDKYGISMAEAQNLFKGQTGEGSDTITLADGTVISRSAAGVRDPEEEKFDAAINEIDREYEDYFNRLGELQTRSDARTTQLIKSIQQSAAVRREELLDINRGVLGARTQAGVRAGRNMYAPEMEQSLLAEEERAGVERIAALDAQEQSLILQAQMAADDKDFDLLSLHMSAMRDVRNEKRQAIMDAHTLAMDNERLARERAQETREQLKFALEVEGELNKPLAEAEDRTYEFIKTMATKYPDAGIVPEDTVLQAQEKLLGSALYQDDIKEMADAGLSPLAIQAINDPQILNSLTAGDRGEVLTQLAAAGYDVSNAIRSAGALTESQDKKVTKVISEFEKHQIVKDFVDSQNKKASIDAILDSGESGPRDLALVYEFMKALDPTSVVRESEYESAAKSGNIFLGGLARFNGFFDPKGGILDENIKEEFRAVAHTKFDIAAQQYNNYRDQKVGQINRYTGYEDGADYLPEFSFNVKAFGGETPDFTEEEENYIQEQLGEGAPLQPLNEIARELGIPDDLYQSVARRMGDPEKVMDWLEKKGWDRPASLSPKASSGTEPTNKLSVTLPTGVRHEGGTASWRNNNPLNIKYGSFAQQYDSLKGSAATDGGHFAAFESPEEGLRAARDLLRSSGYTSRDLETAMRRWSGGLNSDGSFNGRGYGADVAPAHLRGKRTGEMTDSELTELINAMKRREGWREGKIYA